MTDSTSKPPLAMVGDWHGNQGWGQTVIKAAAREGVEVICHVGDFGLDFPGMKRGRYEDRLNRLLVDLGITLVCSPGNHDNLSDGISRLETQEDGLLAWRSNIRVLPKGGRTNIGGLTVGGLGGAYSVDQTWRREGKDWWADEEPTAEQAGQLIAGGSLDILLTHDAPAGVQVRSDFALDADISARAEHTRNLLLDVIRKLQPPNVFCGHWHQRLTHEITHPGGRLTRVDVLDMEHSREGNAVLVRCGGEGLSVVTLFI